MARYTETTIISFNALRHVRVITAEVSDVVINQWNGSAFVSTGTTVVAGNSERVETTGLRLQFVVQAGGAVNIEEGTRA